MATASGRTLSYFHAPSTSPNAFESISHRLKGLSNQCPNKEALVVRKPGEERDVITFSELYSKSQTFAKYLIRNGITKGDYVNIFVENSSDWAVVEFGIMLAGATPINNVTFTTMTSFKPEVLKYFAGLVLDIRDEDTRPKILGNLKNITHQINVKITVLITAAGCKLDLGSGQTSLKDVLDDPVLAAAVSLPTLDPESPCMCLLTSGSTGLPKICVWSHAAVINEAVGFGNAMKLASDDIFFNDRPLGYAAGFPYFILDGITIVTVNTKRTVLEANAEFIVTVINEEHATSGLIALYLVFDLAPLAKSFQLKSVMLSGQRISSKHLINASMFAKDPKVCYGSIECIAMASAFLSQIPTAPADVLGYMTPGTEIKIASDDGTVLSIGEAGEIHIREVSMGSFYILQDGTKEYLKDRLGWFHTGDVGIMQADGLLTVCGRTKEIIKRGTMKIFPSTIEGPLRQHTAVEDIAVVGIKDERLYQELVTFAMLKSGHSLTEDELKAFAIEQFQPELAIDGMGLMPKHFKICECFPKLLSGKIDLKSLQSKAELLFLMSDQKCATRF